MKRKVLITVVLILALAVIILMFGLQVASKTQVQDKKLNVYASDPAEFITDKESGVTFVRNEIVVIAKESTSYDAVKTFTDSHQLKIAGWNGYLREYQILLDNGVNSLIDMQIIKGEFLDSGLFEYVFEDCVVPVSPEGDVVYPNDSEWRKLLMGIEILSWADTIDKHWGIDAIRVPEMWYAFDMISRPAVRVGVLDWQFYTKHKDLVFREVFPEYYEKGYQESHGTHVAGIIGASFNNGTGIAGVVPNVELYGASLGGFCKTEEGNMVIGYSETGVPVTFIHAGLTYLICMKECKVVNMSYGCPFSTIDHFSSLGAYTDFINTINAPIVYALNSFLNEGLDFVIVKSAGNEHNSPESLYNRDCFYDMLSSITDPKLLSRIIVVGGAERGEIRPYQVYKLSTPGERVDVIAPGKDIYSTVCDGYGYMSGTSMAAPYVAGVAAAMWEVNPDLSGEDVKRIIKETATGSYYYADLDEFYHYSMVDALAAVTAAFNEAGKTEDLALPDPAGSKNTNNWKKSYRDILEKNEQSIRLHEQQTAEWAEYYEGKHFSVLFYDLNHDGVEEMLFVGANQNEGEDPDIANLYIYTINGARTMCVVFVPGFFNPYGNGDLYSLFCLKDHSDLLYIQYSTGNGLCQRGYETYSFKGINTLQFTYDFLTDESFEDHYYLNGKSITQNDFDALWIGNDYQEYYEVLASTEYKAGIISWNYDEAIQYLSE